MAPSDASFGGPLCWRLKELCRQRVLEVVRRVLARSGAEDGKRRGLLVADFVTLRIINSVLQLHDLLEEGVCLVECIETPRPSLSVLEAIYFIEPTFANLEFLQQDLLDAGPKYHDFHVFFSHRLSDELLQDLASSPEVVGRLSTFAELNLSFFGYDDRCFHLNDRLALPALLRRGTPDRADLALPASRLATLLVSLAAHPRVLYAARSGGAGVAELLAKELQNRLEEVESKGAPWQKQPPSTNCTVLVVDRTIDWVPLLAHDLHYESATYDILGYGAASLDDCKFTYTDHSDGEEKTVALGEERDPFWERFRHTPIWEVNDLVAQEVTAWAQKDEEMRARTAASGSSSMSQMVSTTLSALQSLPEHKERFKKLQVHSEICNLCNQAIQEQKLVDIAAFEQDLATGVDSAGSGLSQKAVERELTRYLGDPELDSAVKVRLLLLFLSTPEGLALPAAKKAELTQYLPAKDQPLPLKPDWLAAQRPDKKELVARRRQRFKDRVKGTSSPRGQRLRRWEPRLTELLEELASGTIDPAEFPTLRRSGSEGTPATQAMRSKAVIVFVIGGVTLSEVRSAHDVARSLGMETFVGGSCLLTPGMLVETCREL